MSLPKRCVSRTCALLALLLLAAAPLACSDCDLEIVPNALPNGTVGAPYSFVLASHCGGDFWFISQGNLPPGIGLLDNGLLRGTPTTAGTSTFTVGVIDSDSGDRAFKGLALTIDPAS